MTGSVPSNEKIVVVMMKCLFLQSLQPQHHVDTLLWSVMAPAPLHGHISTPMMVTWVMGLS